MRTYSTNEAAVKVGITGAALSKYIKAGKVPAPKSVRIGRVTLHSWAEADIERLRKLLPKIANGRKTRYQKLREKQKTPAGVPVPHKEKKTQPRAAALLKKRETKKKK